MGDIKGIKVRVWDKVQKKMRLDVLSIDVNDFLGKTIYFSSGNYLHMEDAEVMLYIRLKDQNGEPIFEGDIVKGVVKYPQLLIGDDDGNSNFKMGGSVFYDYSGFSLKVIESLCSPERDGMVNYFDFIGTDQQTFEEIEIIGNIYENPELLTLL